MEDGYFTTGSGTWRRQTATRGWKLCVQWKDGSTSWADLKDWKESDPIRVAEYAIANKIESEPACAWWVQNVLKKRTWIIAKVKLRYWKRTHKFLGIQLTHSVEEALKHDEMTGTEFWKKAIEKEMTNNAIAFQFNDEDVIPVGYKFIPFHMIFDIKMDFKRKARFIAVWHRTDAPSSITYSSVVTRDLVRLAYTAACRPE